MRTTGCYPEARIAFGGSHGNPDALRFSGLLRYSQVHGRRSINREQTVAHETVKRRMWPVGWSRGVSVFHRVVVDVIDVIFKITFIADRVFPEATLPDGQFTVTVRGEMPVTQCERSRESRLD